MRARGRAAALAAGLAAALAGAVPSGQAAPSPLFRSSISVVGPAARAAMTPSAWRPGCPVGLGDLRIVRLSHWTFRGRVRRGTLVAHRDAAAQVVQAMRALFAARYPVRRMRPIEEYGGDDFRSIEADNTSAFNCRTVAGSRAWSQHAYGRAIDLNPIENPYVSAGTSSHRASRRHIDRSAGLPGMIVEGDAVVRAFDAIGWRWGGRFRGDKDYQHFSSTGG